MSNGLYTIHTGRWTDWSRGPVLGDQITLTTRNGQVLMAFIAIFITIVGARAWNILGFLLHQFRATTRSKSTFERQLQVLLRNSDSAPFFAEKALRLGFAERKSRVFPNFKSFGYALFAYAFFGLFAAIGILLTVVARKGTVLMIPGHCEILSIQNISKALVRGLLDTPSYLTQNENVRHGLDYASSCYPTPVDSPKQSNSRDHPYRNWNRFLLPGIACNKFAVPSIPWNFSTNVSCPFEQQICQSDETSIQLETEKINSNDILGLNMPRNSQVDAQIQVTCAPINDTKYRTTQDGKVTFLFAQHSSGQPAAAKSLYAYGGRWQFHQHLPHPSDPSISWNPFQVLVARTPFDFIPIKELSRSDAMTMLFLLWNRASFIGSTDDFWFGRGRNNFSFPQDRGRPHKQGAVVGCTQKVRICNPAAGGICMPYGRPEEQFTDQNLAKLKFDNIQLQQLMSYVYQIVFADFTAPITLFGPATLDVHRYALFYPSIYAAPPQHQWQIEMAHLFSASLATVQYSISQSNYRTPLDTRFSYYRNIAPKSLCNSMKIREEGYLNFPVLWLALIFGLGGALILVSVIVNLLLPKFQPRLGKRAQVAREEWDTQGALQLLLRLHDYKGSDSCVQDHWSVTTDASAKTLSFPFESRTGNMEASKDESNSQHESGSGGKEDSVLDAEGFQCNIGKPFSRRERNLSGTTEVLEDEYARSEGGSTTEISPPTARFSEKSH